MLYRHWKKRTYFSVLSHRAYCAAQPPEYQVCRHIFIIRIPQIQNLRGFTPIPVDRDTLAFKFIGEHEGFFNLLDIHIIREIYVFETALSQYFWNAACIFTCHRGLYQRLSQIPLHVIRYLFYPASVRTLRFPSSILRCKIPFSCNSFKIGFTRWVLYPQVHSWQKKQRT